VVGQGIDEGRFAAVEFADDHQQEEVIQLPQRFLKCLLILGCDFEASQDQLQALQGLFFVLQ